MKLTICERIAFILVILGGLMCGFVGTIGWRLTDTIVDSLEDKSFISSLSQIIMIVIGVGTLYILYAVFRKLSTKEDVKQII